MALTGDRYVGTYAGHRIELIRDNLKKRLALHIDGREVASESRILPHNITLQATFEDDGVEHNVVAHSTIRFPSADDSIEVDGQLLPVTKTQ